MPLPSRGAWAAIGVTRAAERSFTMAVGVRGHLQVQTRRHLRWRLMAAERPRRAIRVGQMRHSDKQTRDGLEKQARDSSPCRYESRACQLTPIRSEEVQLERGGTEAGVMLRYGLEPHYPSIRSGV